MEDFDLSSFDTFDVQRRREELANVPISEELLKARKKTQSMVTAYNAMNAFLVASGKGGGSPMEMPTYDDDSKELDKQAGQQANRELIQSLTRLQEQIGRPLTMDEIPAIIKSFNLGPSNMKALQDVLPYIGVTREEQRKRRQESSDINVAAAYDEVMRTHRGLIAGAGPETIGNRIEEAIADINSRDDLSPEEKQAASDQLFADFKDVATLNKESRSEIRAIQKEQDDALKRARITGQNITVSEYMDKAIERVNNGESWEQVNRDIIASANDFISNKDVMASLQSQLKAIKPEDKRTAALKSFQEKQAMIMGGGIKGIEEAIQMEIESRSQNPLMADFTGPMNEAMAIENVFYNLKIAKPEAIDEDAFRAEFFKFKEAIKNLEPQLQKNEIMKAMRNASDRLKLPVRLLLYVVYGKKGYEKLIKEGRT